MLSPRSAEQLAGALHERTLAGLQGPGRAQTAARVRALRDAEEPGALLRAWFPNGAVGLGRHGRYLGSLIAMAHNGHDDEVKQHLAWRPTEYLRRPELLAEMVSSERLIQGLTAEKLAARADVTPEQVRLLESRGWFPSPGIARRVLRVLDVEPTALPSWSDPA